MEHEGRYAILVGINDYDQDPLSGCVNDVNDLKHELINKCNLNEENIYTITSDLQAPLEDPYGSLSRVIYELKEKIITNGYEKNFIFFSFSGHGTRDHDNPYLQFKKNLIPLEAVYNTLVSNCITTNYFFLFDCCQAEHNGLTRARGSFSEEEYIKKLISRSEGTAILYACKKDQIANEGKENGFLTKTLINSIKTKENYDENGILSSEVLISKIKREFIDIDNQDPIGEYRGSGYYPLSSLKFWKEADTEMEKKLTSQKEESKRTTLPIKQENKNTDIDLEKFSSEYRIQSQEIFNETILTSLSPYLEGSENISILYDNDFAKKIYRKMSHYNILEDSISFERIKVKGTSLSFGLSASKASPEEYRDLYRFESLTEGNVFMKMDGSPFPSRLYLGYLILQVKFGTVLVIFSKILPWKQDDIELHKTNFSFEVLTINLQNPLEETSKKLTEYFSSYIKKIETKFKEEKESNSLKDLESFQHFTKDTI